MKIHCSQNTTAVFSRHENWGFENHRKLKIRSELAIEIVLETFWIALVEKLLGLIDSPANGLFFDTGVATEWGENVPDLIRKWGGQDRISSVHFRNVRTEKPYYRYVETFIDDGDCDPLGSMLALAEIGYGYGIDPDHTPSFDGDTGEARIGWTLAVTQLRTLRDLSIREHRF